MLGTNLELVFFIDLINVEEHENQNVIMINETEISTCRHCGTKNYFSKCSLKVQMTTDMVHDLQKKGRPDLMT